MNTAQLKLLKPYEFVLSKPQFSHFSNFINSLQVCNKSSITRFSALIDKDRSSMNRFLTESPWKIEDLEPVYLAQVERHIETNSYMLIDDTISHRPYARKVDKANYHFDHTNNKQSLGYCIVTSTILTNKAQIPYKMKPYYRKIDCNDIQFRTKNEITKELILSSKNNSNVSHVIFDTWFSNDIVIGACKEAKKHYVTQIKSNRNVTISNNKRYVREHAKEIKESDWEVFTYGNCVFRIFATSAFISKIGSVHLIFSQILDEDTEKWSDIHYIISDEQNVSSPEIIVTYLDRGGIESFHREAKQNTGLEGYFLRKCRGIERYLFLVKIAYSHLVLQSIKMEESRTIGEMCIETKTGLYMETYDRIRRNPERKEEICRSMAEAGV